MIGLFVSADSVLPDLSNSESKNRFDPQVLNRYAYCQNNPLKYVDPSGEAIETPWDAFNVSLGLTSMYYNLKKGNPWSAAFDFGGVLYDSFATVVPVLPAFASSAIGAKRSAKYISNANTLDILTIGESSLVRRSADALARRTGEDIYDIGEMAILGKGGQTLKIIAHNSTYIKYTGAQLAKILQKNGFEASNIEILVCDGAIGKAGKISYDLSKILGVPVKAARAKVKLTTESHMGIPRVIDKQKMKYLKGDEAWKTFGFWRGNKY